ncbi:hypothetical protein PYW08_007072 [Mythimna loreyi]|uniref:Uncharacterized protein n=1 Tax=Mythimna loreyi TaxID=667449 RepID=A0ACC2RAT5_9NEOP|nr:hypothetical protein PYW08_007072 [Mythimna loreyi]
MTDYRIVLLSLFIGIAICDPFNTGHSTRTRDNIADRNKTTNVSSEATTLKDKVEIKVYYETLCPFSVNFFVYQLKPAMERLGSHLDIHLIPYGHAKTRRVQGGYKFSCQHGIPECFGNTVQACAVDLVRNVTRSVNFNTCLMQNTSYRTSYQYYIFVLHWCGTQHDVNVQEIWKCLHSPRGSILLKGHGDATHALDPSFVPYLTIDGSTHYQDQAMSNLFATVCLMLKPMPRECTII